VEYQVTPEKLKQNPNAEERSAMHRGEFHEVGVIKSIRARAVQETVEALITERGYDTVILDLVHMVQYLGQKSMTDPKSRNKKRDFYLWAAAAAVRTAILKHYRHCKFEQMVTDSDRSMARQIGITLD
jgi:hypothetical protein